MGFFSKLLGTEKDDPLKNAMEAIYRLIDNEEYQNKLLPEPLGELIKNTVACDVISGATGQFGFEATNPIPVNGAIGELSYLSRLETLQGERLLFHRIGAIDKLDVFEAVTYSGSAWYVFFVDMYHPRRSKRAPEGFGIAKEPRQFSGFHNHCANFPYDFVKAKQASPDFLRLAYIPLGHVTRQIENKAFNRPLSHKAKLDLVKSQLTSVLIHDDNRGSDAASPTKPVVSSLKDARSLEQVVVDLCNKFRDWAQVMDADDVTSKAIQYQMIHELGRAYVFALFVMRGLKKNDQYLDTDEFVKLLGVTSGTGRGSGASSILR
jgi:hypothetical protein